ncbi:MAG TPA: sigma-70 family RNA polymerase sigma factor [Tepidisphaeraceae bacterium]|jgi:RNA polymerase sigma factor (sigma-70 family)|nr:sigma-70 family RNA polymerase sigma factor [Tepidisphaeraceae bacterium]
MKDDRELLAEYVRDGAEGAFAQVVAGNVGMVYSVCRRILGDAHLAEDATQAVFFLLARKAASLNRDVIPAGWLHNAARNVCANLRRSEQIRRRHEMKAAQENCSAEKAVTGGNEIEPAKIDAALGRLRDADRDPILLRFFQGQSFRQVGETLRISEDAAKKRTERALERLRELLRPAGGTAMSAAAVGAMLTSCSHATPPSLAAAATAAALHGAVPKTLPLLLKGAIGMSATTKTQLAIAAAVAAVLLGTGAVLVTMSIGKDEKTQSVRVQGAGQGQRDAQQPPSAVVDATWQPQPRQMPDWIPGGTAPMLMGRGGNEMRGVFSTIEAEHFEEKQGGIVAAPGLTKLGGGNWARYGNVDLDAGANQFVANLSAGVVDAANSIEVRLDSPTAPAIAVLEVKKTADWSTFVTQSAALSPASGVHDVYLTFTGPARVADLNWFKLVRTPRSASNQITGNSYDDARGVNDHDGVIANIDRGDFLRYSQIDFGEGMETFEACIGLADQYSDGSRTTQGQFEVRIDALDGPVVGLLMTQPTGAFRKHVPQSTPITRTSGIHDVYFTFRTNGVCDLEWFTFKK